MVRWANLFRNASEGSPPLPITRRIPEGMRVYCVGDLHGRDDLLRQMAERVQADLQVRSFDKVVKIIVGDYIERGLWITRVVFKLARGEAPIGMTHRPCKHEKIEINF